MNARSLHSEHWIDGQWVPSSSQQTFMVENPTTASDLHPVARGTAEDVDRAVEAARRAFISWRRVPGLARCEMLHHSAHTIRAHRVELAELMTLEGGKTLLENLDEVEWVAACFDYYAELGRDLRGRVIAPVQPGQFNMVVKEPLGVVGCIVPWNYPLLLLAWKLAPCLAIGNTVVIKPSELTPLSTLRMVALLDRLPPGVVNVVTGLGAEAGQALVEHRDVAMIAFTGSLLTGKRILKAAADTVKRTHMELGGSDPFIVCDDVDLDVAARAAAWAAFLNNGQVCTSAERIYVFDSIHDEFVEKLVAIAKDIRLGDPMGPDVDLGPMVSSAQRAKVMARVAEAVQAGATLHCGGDAVPELSPGYFMRPAVLTGVTQEMPLIRDEFFGPVAPVIRVKDLQEAIACANDSIYGLGASIMTRSLERAMEAMEGIKAGTFWINDPLTDNEAGPFGGMRQSGNGRELGWEGLEAFCDTKHVHMDYKQEHKPYWFPYDWSAIPRP